MAVFSPFVREMIHAFQCLPGVGRKTAQRMALHLLERDRQGGLNLAHKLIDAMQGVRHCQQCRHFCEEPLCTVCQDQNRDHAILCIVETSIDLLSIEQSGGYKGHYFVLSGHLSPIEGIGPEDLGIMQLLEKLKADSNAVKEVIVATNPTIEGEATAHFLIDQIKPLNIAVSRIAHGVPIGGELEYIDGGTLSHAIRRRHRCM